ncbi:uncharacterized protein LOC119600196 [Lucilia sericata]|uniref:uncharacterized protein LOC119600196 n=1 Tax=Lucilia sericata TaxID=13632 RepID=UPI0018A853EA|nr:uncharacterized protein LOC119600196 [Lucilia sericata]
MATSEENGNSAKQEKFLFDCDHLITFCTNFGKSDIEDQTDSVLETKLNDLENRWLKLQTSYESLMVSPRSENSKEYKENAKTNFNACSETYYTCHTKSKCASTNTCFICKSGHHTLLHLQKSQNTYKPIQTNNTTETEKSSHQKINDCTNNQKMDHNQNPSTSQNCQVQANFASNNENILLRTALVQIEHIGQLFTVRALIDPGSQRTFLFERVRSLLQLPYQKSYVEIVGIGGQLQSASKECNITIFAKRYNLKFSVNSIILPKLTKQIPTLSFEPFDSTQLSNIDLADPNFNQSTPIDLILVKPSENTSLNDTLRKFWEQEELSSHPVISDDDQYCEDFYKQTTTRNASGRYIVRLPFKKEFPDHTFLGSSRIAALVQYSRINQSLSKTPELQNEYNNVLKEYLTLDLMEPVSYREVVSDGKYFSFYLPHHAVIRPEHKSTKVRVVFNASRKTKSGHSLNDVLYTGPTLQSDLITLKTVTFGVNCAPFLAIRTLHQLAKDSQTVYPLASKILLNETYVDDILSGGHTLEEARKSQTQILETLKSAGFILKKITANDSQLLKDIPSDDLYDSDLLRFHETSSMKTLGIKWNALTDTFSYSCFPIPHAEQITKRKILSSIASIFDPAGWITPIVIRAKMLMQELWLEGLQWDDEVNPEILNKWNKLLTDLSHIDSINIPRWLQYNIADVVQIHGFSDASKGAYCATVYLRCQSSSQVVFSNLIVAKSKVAPIQPICLPRLELCGAVLLSKLVKYVTESFRLPNCDIFLWTDSSIVMGWLSKPSHTWETYVANRSAQIHSALPHATWGHVRTHDNPADLGTRGCKANELANNILWWQGPQWLIKPQSEWPKKTPVKTQEIDKRVKCFQTSVQMKFLHIKKTALITFIGYVIQKNTGRTSRSSDKNFSSKMHINSVVYVTHKPYVRVNNEA